MARLTDAHVEQIKNMKEDGKSNEEIRVFFKNTYNLKLHNDNLARPKASFGSKAVEQKIKRAYKRKALLAAVESAPGTDPALPSDQEVEDPAFAEHIHAAFQIYRKGFMKKVAGVLTC